jgi:hypothetical protein
MSGYSSMITITLCKLAKSDTSGGVRISTPARAREMEMPEGMSLTRTRGQRAISSAGRVAGAAVWLAFWWCNGLAIDHRCGAADASPALSQAIYQNTPGKSEGLPLGLSWNTGNTSTPNTPAPSGWSALTGWAQVYQQAGAAVSQNNASDTVQVQNFKTYVLLTDGSWVQVQDQATSGIVGGNYIADFSTDEHTAFKTDRKNSDGSVTLSAPPSGYNDHFFPGMRGAFTPGTIVGVFVEADMRTNNPGANLVAQLGVDWWKDVTAEWAGDDVNNLAAGINDWLKLTTQWRTLYYTSLTRQQLQANPPPTLLGRPPA